MERQRYVLKIFIDESEHGTRCRFLKRMDRSVRFPHRNVLLLLLLGVMLYILHAGAEGGF